MNGTEEYLLELIIQAINNKLELIKKDPTLKAIDKATHEYHLSDSRIYNLNCHIAEVLYPLDCNDADESSLDPLDTHTAQHVLNCSNCINIFAYSHIEVQSKFKKVKTIQDRFGATVSKIYYIYILLLERFKRFYLKSRKKIIFWFYNINSDK